MLTTFAALCQLQTLGRADYNHQAQAAFPAMIVLGHIGSPALIRVHGRLSRGRKLSRLAGFSAVTSAFAITIVVGALSVPSVNLEALGPTDRDLIAGIRTISDNTSKDELIFVGLTDHRITFLNDMVAYYLADRRSAVRVAMFNPGVTNTDRVQLEMAADLDRAHASLLLLDVRWANVSEAFNDSSILGSTILDSYIGAHYVLACDYDSIRILALPERLPSVTCAATDEDERLIDVLAGVRPIRAGGDH